MNLLEIKEELQLYTEARNHILKTGQSYTIRLDNSERTMQRAQLSEIEKTIKSLHFQLKAKSGGGTVML